MNMVETRRQMFAVTATAILLVAGLGIIVDSQERDDYEVDASFTLTSSVLILASLGLFGTGYVLGAASAGSEQDPAYSRANEASILAASLASGVMYYQNALDNYSNIWPLTNDHWDRQAEIAAAALWDEGVSFDSEAILTKAHIYENLVDMVYNSTAQVNRHYDDIALRVEQWNSTENADYFGDGMMSLEIRYGNKVISVQPGSDFKMRMGVVLRSTDANDDRAMLYGGEIYSSATSQIRNGNTVIDLPAGWYDLESDPDFYAGIWEFTNGRSYFGSMMTLVGSNAGSPGIIIEDDGEVTVLTATNVGDAESGASPGEGVEGEPDYVTLYDCDITDGTAVYDSIDIAIVPSETENQHVIEATYTLASFAHLYQTLMSSANHASGAAETVWSMYDHAGEASPYLSTLIVPENYANVDLTPAQREMITTLAMQQLYDYWDRNGGAIKQDSYVMTNESLSLLCRGDVTITDFTVGGSQEKLEYDDVIFTPIFYEDTTLNADSRPQEIDHQCFVMIWGSAKDAEGNDVSLSDFKIADAEMAELIFLGEGATMTIASMKYGEEYVDSLFLDCDDIEIINPGDIIIPDPVIPEKENDLGELLRLIFIILGAAILLWGAKNTNIVTILIGAALILIGFVATEWIENVLEKYFDLVWRWPGS